MSASRLTQRGVDRAPLHGLRVVPFARLPQRADFLSMSARIVLERWKHEAAELGIGRVRLEHAEPSDPPDIGSFILLYRHDAQWASWGVAVAAAGGYEVWETGGGATLGCFDTLVAALDAVLLAV